MATKLHFAHEIHPVDKHQIKEDIFPAELSGLLFIGDAILQVQVLRNAGEEVTLTVSFLKRAPAFLKLPLNEDCAFFIAEQVSYVMEYPFGQFGSAVLAIFPSKILAPQPTPEEGMLERQY
ncbi:hypothetical protein WISP_114049 [Willisornis vidua]|uniref:Uncharacterized protein n=1 Tax=Willisornis vidua TaxID=1566151 RepID=A0ABQ9CVI1_9PASS|nr:hypothetical protein WISP_114049 [Willisornis vidua]